MRHTATRRVVRAAAHKTKTSPRVQKALAGSEVVLLAEDDPEVRESIRETLERYGYSVLVAATGAEALRYYRMLNAPPDLLLTNTPIPELTGAERADAFASEGRLPRVLMLSTPFTDVELARKVREVLDS